MSKHKQRSRHRAATFHQTLDSEADKVIREYEALSPERKAYCEAIVRAIDSFDPRDTHPLTGEPLDEE